MKLTRVRKKVLAISTALMLMMNVFFTGTSVLAAGTPELELGWSLSKDNIKPNEEVDVTVSLKNYENVNIKGISGLQVDVKLDTTLVDYVEDSAQVIAEGANGDNLAADYNPNDKMVKLIYFNFTKEGTLPKIVNDLFTFKVMSKASISKDSIANFICNSFTVTDADGNRVIPVTNSPSVNVLVEKPSITLNGAQNTGDAYHENVTVNFNKGTGTISKDGGAPVDINSGKILNTDGKYTVNVIDAAGNTQTTSFTIDKTVASISLITLPTTGSVTNTTKTVDLSDPTLSLTAGTVTISGDTASIKAANVKEGTVLPTAGGVVELTYSLGSKQQIPLTSAMCDVSDVGTDLGLKIVMVNYLGYESYFYVNVVQKQLTSISMDSSPSKLTYIEGQDLVLTGGRVKLNYDNGTNVIVPLTSDMIVGYQKNQIGNQTVTVDITGKQATFNVTVNQKSLQAINVTTAPTKTKYIEGNSFNNAGMVVTATYDNGTTAPVTGYTVSTVPLTVGQTSVVVSYGGKTVSVPIEVVAKQLESIAISTQPTKKSFKVNTPFSAAGGKITLTYDNGTSEIKDITDAMCSGYDMATVSNSQTVTVTYPSTSIKDTYTIEVLEKALLNISIKTEPSVKSFIEGTSFTTDGIITLHYDNDTTVDKPIVNSMVTGVDMNKVGAQTATITENGKQVTYKVTIVAKSLASIAVTTPPTKTTYIEGNDFIKTGMVVTATYDNGTTSVVTDYTVTPKTFKLGDSIVTVSYQGKTATTPVTVNAKQLTGIAITTKPVKLSYLQGTDLDKFGLVVTASYDNGTTAVIPVTNEMVTGYDKDVVGKQSVTVTSGTQTAKFEVEVISNVEVKKIIDKIENVDTKNLTTEDKTNIKSSLVKYETLSPVEQDALKEVLFPSVDFESKNHKVEVNSEVGSVPLGYSFEDPKLVEPKGQTLKALKEKHGENSKFLALYDITLNDIDGNVTHDKLKGSVELKIKLDGTYKDGDNITVVYVKDDGSFEELATRVVKEGNDYYAVFSTNHFSSYGIVQKVATTSTASTQATTNISTTPKTGDSSQAGLWLMLMVASATLLVVNRRKKVLNK